MGGWGNKVWKKDKVRDGRVGESRVGEMDGAAAVELKLVGSSGGARLG